MHRSPSQFAFSLVELSIVLVILGLLVGGILAGQSLIRAAELRSVTTEADKITTALNAFRDKYMGYPGDITNATQFWGVAGGDGTGNDNACRIVATTDSKTCNGDGNGLINDPNTGTGANETLRFWKHLSNAGLVEGQFTQIGPIALAGVNILQARIASNAGWWVGHQNVSGSANVFDGAYGNSMNLFQRTSPATVRGVMTGAEAWNVDTKADDGKPGLGKVISNYSATYSDAGVACTTAATGADFATATYQLSTTTKDCGLFWLRL